MLIPDFFFVSRQNQNKTKFMLLFYIVIYILWRVDQTLSISTIMCCYIFLYLGLERMIYPVTTFSCKVRCLAETKLAPGNIKSEYNFSNTFVLVVFCSLLRQYQIREWFVKEKQTASVIKEIVKYYLCTGIPLIMWYVQVAWEGSCGNKSLGRRAQQ